MFGDSIGMATGGGGVIKRDAFSSSKFSYEKDERQLVGD